MKTPLIVDTQDHVSFDAILDKKTRVVDAEAILCVTRSGILARAFPVAVTGRRVAFNQDIRAIIPNRDELEPQYLYSLLSWLEHRIVSEGIKRGATVHSIRSGFLENLRIPLPPVPVQRQIAETLKQQFAKVEKARHAIEEQFDAAERVFGKYLDETFSTREAMEWPRRRLKNCTSKIGSGITPKGGQSAYVERGIPLIRSQNVHISRFLYEGLAHITPEQDAAMLGSRVQEGDILLNITGASIGRVCIVPNQLCPANVNQHVSIIRSNGSFNPEFIAFYLARPTFQALVRAEQGGATRDALTKTQIEQFEIPVPPLDLQRHVAAEINAVLNHLTDLLTSLETGVESIEALPRTLLAEAFTGTL